MLRSRVLVTTGLVALLVGTPASGSTAAVYRCEDDDRTLFSQFPCAGGAERHAMPPLPVIRTAPLTDAERRRLEALSRDLIRGREAARQARHRAAAAQQRVQREQDRRCRRARQALEQLARSRREGYSLNEAARLKAREADLDAEVRTHC